MDISPTIIPDSSQINADDLIPGPVTYTVREVKRGSAEQPIDVMLVETDRAYRPSKSMRRVLIAAWGKESTVYAGRRLTLYRDPEVRFGADRVAGVKISHLSHIGSRMEIALTESRGKRKPHIVEPLPDEPAATTGPTDAQIAASTDVDQLRAWYLAADKTHPSRAAILARVDELQAPADGPMVTRPESEGSDPWAQSGESLLDQGAGS